MFASGTERLSWPIFTPRVLRGAIAHNEMSVQDHLTTSNIYSSTAVIFAPIGLVSVSILDVFGLMVLELHVILCFWT